MQCEAAAHPLRFELLVIVCTTNDIHDFKSRCVSGLFTQYLPTSKLLVWEECSCTHSAQVAVR